jgi:hypothetical protein
VLVLLIYWAKANTEVLLVASMEGGIEVIAEKTVYAIIRMQGYIITR